MVLAPSLSSATAVGVAALLVSLLCLGTWPALIRLCTWGAHQEIKKNNCGCFASQARHVCHVYLDYSISYAVSSCIPIFIYLLCFSHDDFDSSFILVLVAIMGGSCLSFGNLCMQWAVVKFHAPLTTVLAIQASLTVVVGTSLNYLLQPSMTARPLLLLSGVVAFLVAIGLATWAHSCYMMMQHHSSRQYEYETCGNVSPSEFQSSNDGDDVNIPYKSHQRGGGLIALPTLASGTSNADSPPTLDYMDPPPRSDSFYSDGSLVHSKTGSSACMGLVIAICGGLAFGFFSPAFNIAVNNPFGWGTADQQGLSVAVANIWFSLAFCACSVVGNAYLMSRRVQDMAPSSLVQYATRETWRDRGTALVAGLVCALGNLLQFQGGKLAGFATADLVQAFPLVATVWDVVVFGEFRAASGCVVALLACMYICYLLGIVLLACSIDY